ncbi:MAG: serine--tRNA ligase [Euryarchaeota archaeon]|nr:serine--tRNA ligase [Euryarchaeota archaeon]
MLSIYRFRNNKEEIIKGLKKRNFENLEVIDKVVELDLLRKKLQQNLEEILFESNTISKEIAKIFKSNESDKNTDELKKKSSALKSESKKISEELDSVKKELHEHLITMPNIPEDEVPEGSGEEDNIEIFISNNNIKESNEYKNHWDISKEYDILDFELGSKITGSGFPVYKGAGAKLQRALISYFLDKNIDAGYSEYNVPHLVNQESAFSTGQLPDKDGQMYHIGNDNLYLIPTSEVPLTNIYRDVIIENTELPVCMTGYTPCFRREAGSYGSEVRGLNRIHQFDKVEIVRIEHPDKSKEAFDKMISHVKSILNELKLDYRIVNLCSGDLGFTSAITYDFEVYSKGQNKWLEISSVSNFRTFQSNRLNLRYKDKDGKNKHLHTLNGSSLALPRVVAAILENNQTKEGISIPEVLVPYTGFDIIK